MILPFTPPAQWTQLPAGAMSAQVKNVWQRDLPGGKHATFTEIVVPLPANPTNTATSVKKAISQNSRASVSSQPVSLCGVQGQLITSTMPPSGENAVLQQEIVSKGGYTYMLLYSRPRGSTADPAIGSILRSFCPSGTSALTALSVPPNWKSVAGSGFQSMGVWLGTQPMQTMVLMKGPQMPSLTDIVHTVQTQNGKSAAKILQLVSTRQTALCGNPALFVTARVNVPSLPMMTQQAVTQANGTSYLLMYTYPQSEQPDAAAVASLHTLCATGSAASPAASASPGPR